jgi:hypothetical protein
MEIFPASRDTKISLGAISGQIQISLVEIPFMEIDEPIEIMTREIEIDLSGYHIKSSK